MKKLLALILALALVFSMVACGGGDNANSNPDENGESNGSEESNTPAFIADLQNADKIVIGVSPDYPPYEYYDEEGNITGFDVDAATKIVEIMNQQNGTNLTVEWVPMDFSTIVSAVQVGQVDIGVSCFTYDPERDVLFSDYYLKSAQCIVVQADSDIETIADISGKTVGAGSGTTCEKAALEAGANCTSMGDYIQMFEILTNAALAAVACDEAEALEYGAPDDFRVLDEKLIDEEVSIITENDNTALMDAINAAIAEFVASDDYNTYKTNYGLN